jgi:hypothetical protein
MDSPLDEEGFQEPVAKYAKSGNDGRIPHVVRFDVDDLDFQEISYFSTLDEQRTCHWDVDVPIDLVKLRSSGVGAEDAV